MKWSALSLLVSACASAGTGAARPVLVQRGAVLCADSTSKTELRAGADAVARTALQERAEGVLVRHCAECHASRRASALPAALAVFDLDKPAWPARFNAQRFDVALARLADQPEADQAAFRAFRAFRDAQLTAP